MATVTYIKESKQSISAMKGLIDYCCQEQKVTDENGRRLISGVNCDGENAFNEFLVTKNAYHKTTGINFYQYVQSFSPQENITPQQAHEIALEFATKAWPGYEVLVATHSDADHTHSHFVINSVSFENGKKLRQNPNTLRELRALSDEICQQHGFSTLKPYEKDGVKISTREHRSAQKKESWKFKLMAAIETSMKVTGSKDGFIRAMRQQGYAVTWTDERKYITYQCPNGMKCRDIKLHYDIYRKENLENEFEIRKLLTEKLFGRTVVSGESGSGKQPGTHTVPADSVRYPAGAARFGDADAEGRDAVPADALPSDRYIGDERTTDKIPQSDNRDRENGGERSDGIAGRAKQPDRGDSDSGKSADGQRGAGAYRTGWEGAREVYFRLLVDYVRRKKAATLYAGTASQTRGQVYNRGLGVGSSLVVGGVSALAALSDVGSGGSEDEDERKRRMEAEENSAILGLVLGTGIALADLVIGSLESESYDNEAMAQRNKHDMDESDLAENNDTTEEYEPKESNEQQMQ